MKSIARGIMLLLCLYAAELRAQVPQKMSYQAVLRNGSNALIVNTTVGMQISILEGSETGTPTYIETHQAKTNANGLITLAIGTGAPVKGVFADIKWGSNTYFVKTETDPSGGTNYTITGISQLMSVPYAFYAANSNSATASPGKSAFEVWKEMPGNSGKTETDFFEFLKGPKGDNGAVGKSAFDVWKEIPGNENKTITDYATALKGNDGKSAYDLWKAQPGNSSKSETDFIESNKGAKGDNGASGKSAFDLWKEIPGNENKTITEYASSLKGTDGKSAFEVWKEIPGNETKTITDYGIALKGKDGKSAYDLWKEIPGNENKTIAEYAGSLKGTDGKSAFGAWKELPGNSAKTETDFIESLKGAKGDNGDNGTAGKSAFDVWKEIPGNENKTIADYGMALKGVDGKSAYDAWKELPGNSSKTETDFLESLKGAKGDNGDNGTAGKSAFDVWKEIPGNETKTITDYGMALKGADGKSAYDAWKELPGNSSKTEADFIESLKGAKGDNGDNGVAGKSAFDVWKEIPGNENKTITDYMSSLKGADGKSAYDLWKELPGNSSKTETDFIESLKGAKGDSGDNGTVGKSAFDVWKEIPGNENKTITDYGMALKGVDGKSAYDSWKELPGNSSKTETDFIESLKGAKGDNGDNGVAGKSAFDVWKEIPGNETKTIADYGMALKGADGKSAYDLWKEQPGNSSKTEIDFIESLKGAKGDNGDNGTAGKSAFDVWKEIPGNENKTITDYGMTLKGVDGKSAYDLWKEIPGNEDKTITEYGIALKGADGKSAYDVWKELPGNGSKTITDYAIALKGTAGKTMLNGIIDPVTANGAEGDFYINTATQQLFGPKQADDSWPAPVSLKGSNGTGIDFKGSFADEAAFTAAGNSITLNKAYYNTTDKKSYIYDGTAWQVFAQDGSAGGGLAGFNVDRPITRQGLPVSNLNLGAGGKSVAEFLEAVFFPALAATPPTTTFTTAQTSFPYATWKTWAGFAKIIDFNWSLTNQSKLDATDDKNISSIRLLNGSTELQTVAPVNTGTSQNGTFSNIAFSNPSGSKTADFSQTYTLEVKDAQPNTVTKSLTLTMQRAVQLSYSAPSLSPSTSTYEYAPTDIPLTLGWSISRGDETITDIKVNGTSTGSTAATGSTTVVFRSPNNGGAASQSFTLQAAGDIYGAAGVQTSAAIKWESTLYRGAVSSPGVSPCDAGFGFTDAQVKALTARQLGGSWKGTTGFDFACDAAGQYPMFAYPDDGTTPTVQYFDPNFNVWQSYPANQVKIIDRTNFMNASGYNGKNYKLVFVCVEYKNVTVKIRLQ